MAHFTSSDRIIVSILGENNSDNELFQWAEVVYRYTSALKAVK